MITSSLPTVATVEFQGAQLVTIQKDDIEFAAMKPIVEGIGLSWQGQQEKFQQNKEKFNCQDILSVASDGKNREMLCIPITKLNGWLFSINPNKIPNLQTREKVVSYQEECFIALYDYWHKGVAERKTPLLPETLIPSEQHELSAVVHAKAAATVNVGKARAEIWSRFKNKFKVARYDQIPRSMIQQALKYVSEMEVKGVKLLPTTAPAHVEPLEIGLLKIKIEHLEAKNGANQMLIESLQHDRAMFKELYQETREQVRDSFALIRDLTRR